MAGSRTLAGMVAITAAIALAGPALAHPHVFIDAQIEVIFDAEGRATALRINWTYDEFYSLVLIEERGLDGDYDGHLTEAETAALSGFDMNWDPDFPGDTYALLGDAPLDLSRPSDWTAVYDGGRVTSTHLRSFAEPVTLGAAPLVVQVYDPGFYTAYSIVGVPVVTNRAGCEVAVYEPDRAAADAILTAAIEELAGTPDVEAAFPAIGSAYAEEVRVTCAAPS